MDGGVPGRAAVVGALAGRPIAAQRRESVAGYAVGEEKHDPGPPDESGGQAFEREISPRSSRRASVRRIGCPSRAYT